MADFASMERYLGRCEAVLIRLGGVLPEHMPPDLDDYAVAG